MASFILDAIFASNLNELNHLSKPQQKAIKELVKEFMDIWATKEWDIGVTDLVECDVELKPEAKSKVHNAKLIPMSPKFSSSLLHSLISLSQTRNTNFGIYFRDLASYPCNTCF